MQLPSPPHLLHCPPAAELYPVPPGPETCGRTEEMIGRWLQARGCRDKVVLATKVMGGSKVGGCRKKRLFAC